MQSTEYIAGFEKVIAALGYWPTFHDAEVISFSAVRSLPVQVGNTKARLSVHVRTYETVGEGTAQYAQVLRKSVVVCFAFLGACDLELSGFNHQNVINSLTVSAIANEQPGLLVDIDSIWGFGGTLQCVAAEVESVEILSNAEA